MAETRHDSPRQLPTTSTNPWQDYGGPAGPLVPSGSGLMLAGLALLGLGVVAWYYLGPDIKRYIKIRNM